MKYPRILMALSAVLLALVVVRPGHAHQFSVSDCQILAKDMSSAASAKIQGESIKEALGEYAALSEECRIRHPGECIYQDQQDNVMTENYISQLYDPHHQGMDPVEFGKDVLQSCLRGSLPDGNPDAHNPRQISS